MLAVIQRVDNASVNADGTFAGAIGRGLYILIGVKEGDTEADAILLAEKISKLRIFSDENDKMNLSVRDIDGECLVVSNFTLNANYRHGNRPDYLSSAAPCEADRLYEFFKAELSNRTRRVESGVFGAHMISEITTNGPVTIVMDSDVLKGGKK